MNSKSSTSKARPSTQLKERQNLSNIGLGLDNAKDKGLIADDSIMTEIQSRLDSTFLKTDRKSSQKSTLKRNKSK